MPGEQGSRLDGAPRTPFVLVDDGHEKPNARLDPRQVAQVVVMVADRDGVVIEHASHTPVTYNQVVPVKISVQDHPLSSRPLLDAISPVAPPANELHVTRTQELTEARADGIRVGLWLWSRKLYLLAQDRREHSGIVKIRQGSGHSLSNRGVVEDLTPAGSTLDSPRDDQERKLARRFDRRHPTDKRRSCEGKHGVALARQFGGCLRGPCKLDNVRASKPGHTTLPDRTALSEPGMELEVRAGQVRQHRPHRVANRRCRGFVDPRLGASARHTPRVPSSLATTRPH